jgi:hypothetical protein
VGEIMKDFKLHIATIALLFIIPFSTLYAQSKSIQDNNITLELLKGDRNESIYSKSQFYTLQVSNKGKNQQPLEFLIYSTNCDGVQQNEQSSLDVQIVDESLARTINTIVLNPKESKKIIIKTTRASSTRIETWSCYEIKAVATSGKTESNAVIIKTFIPGSNYGH